MIISFDYYGQNLLLFHQYINLALRITNFLHGLQHNIHNSLFVTFKEEIDLACNSFFLYSTYDDKEQRKFIIIIEIAKEEEMRIRQQFVWNNYLISLKIF